MSSERFRLQQIVLAGSAYPGGQDYTVDRQRQVQALVQDGSRYEQSHIVTQAAPGADIESLHLGWIFGGSAPWNASSDLPIAQISGDGLDLYGAKESVDVPGIDSASEHVRHRISAGIIHLARLSWSKGGNALATLRVLAKSSDGEADPIVRSIANAPGGLPAGVTNTHAWVVTAATLGAGAVDLESVDIELDPALMQAYQLGLPQPKDVIGTGGPVVIGLSGMTHDLRAADGAGACSLVLRQRSHGGGLQAQTLTLTFYGAYVWEEPVSGASGGPRQRQFRATTRHDGTNRPMTWSLSV